MKRIKKSVEEKWEGRSFFYVIKGRDDFIMKVDKEAIVDKVDC